MRPSDLFSEEAADGVAGLAGAGAAAQVGGAQPLRQGLLDPRAGEALTRPTPVGRGRSQYVAFTLPPRAGRVCFPNATLLRSAQQNPRRLGKRPFFRAGQMGKWADLRLLPALGLPQVIVDLHLQPEVG